MLLYIADAIPYVKKHLTEIRATEVFAKQEQIDELIINLVEATPAAIDMNGPKGIRRLVICYKESKNQKSLLDGLKMLSEKNITIDIELVPNSKNIEVALGLFDSIKLVTEK